MYVQPSTRIKVPSNKNILQFVANEIHMHFFTLYDMLVRKMTISASLRKNHFPNILEQAPLCGTIHTRGCHFM